jgi:hypothetical protein
MSPEPGTRVTDTSFGPATIVRETKSGYLVRLDKPAGMEVDRPIGALRFADGSTIDETAQAPAAREVGQRGGDGAYEARVAIDALRFGVVPASHLAELTLGHEKLEAWMSAQLPEPGQPPRTAGVYGPFGSGKSHTMAAIREIARQRNYLAMATEINGTEISLSQPRELLASLLAHLTGSTDLDGSAPLLALTLSARKGASHPAGTRSPLLAQDAATVKSLSSAARFDDVQDTIERLLGSDPSLNRSDFKALVRDTLDWDDWVRMTYDRDFSPRALVSYTPAEDRPYDFARALIGYATLAHHAGYRGLIVTVDELEVEDALMTASRRSKLIDFVVAMRAELGNRQPLEGGLAIVFAAVGDGADVEDDVVRLIVDVTPGEPFELQPWRRADLMVLSRRIHELYVAAYGVTAPYDEAVASGVFKVIDRHELQQSGEIRAFIRGYVARLDVAFGPPVA